MTNFIPGREVSQFTTKKGRTAIIRYPQWQDLDLLTDYINKLSAEDTYINLSGEKISREEEIEFLAGMFKSLEKGDKVYLCCFVGSSLAGACSVDRNITARKRCRHEAILGITLAQDFRSEGIGFQLAQTAIKEAKKKIAGLKLITLHVFGVNQIAQKLYHKLGFTKAGLIPGHVLYRGKFIDGILMYLKI